MIDRRKKQDRTLRAERLARKSPSFGLEEPRFSSLGTLPLLIGKKLAWYELAYNARDFLINFF